jgi:hypothetical protein
VRFTWDTNTSRVGRGWRGTGDAPAVLDDRIMLLGLLFAFAATVLNSWAGLLESDATWRVTRHRPLMTQPRYLGGLLVNGLGWVCTVVALRHLPVFAVQAILGAAITVTAIVACLIGLVLVAASADTSSPPALPSAVHYVLIAATAALVVAIFASWPSSLPWPMAVIAGLGLGGTSLTARAVRIDGGPSALTQLLAQPPTYLVVAFWIIGLVSYSRALGLGNLARVRPIFMVTEVIVPGLVAIALLGDTVRAAWWPAMASGLLLAVFGAVVLARSPAVHRYVARARSTQPDHPAQPGSATG